MSAGSPPTTEVWSLADVLEGEPSVSAVDMFARRADGAAPQDDRYYRDLIPLSAPQAGEQYAFEVDLDACSGCKACVTACHGLNGLDEGEVWRDVGLLHGGSDELPVLQHVTSACHHCLDPACLNVCPVKAYEKDPRTGIVKHLDDQCFGCQYCVLACPYDVPKYNKQKGIVRKCDMCSSRLAVGEAPACVEACPHEAIRIRTVRQRDILADCETNQFLPGAPEPHHTLPTTHYKTCRVLPRNLLPADYYAVKPEHAHWPLVFMLVLTQLSVGAFLVEWLLAWFSNPAALAGIRPLHAAGSLLLGLLALAASTCHLGRPQYAFRAVLGLGTSWLSREIVVFGLFALAASLYALSVWRGGPQVENLSALQTALAAVVVATGLAGVFCSVMIYHCTRRPYWNGASTGLKFLSTTLILGIAAALLSLALGAAWDGATPLGRLMSEFGVVLCQALIVVTLCKLVFEAAFLRHLRRKQNTPLKRSAQLLARTLARATCARFALGVLGGLLLPLLLISVAGNPDASERFMGLLVAMLFVCSAGGELLERYLFFIAVVAPKMPGGVTT